MVNIKRGFYAVWTTLLSTLKLFSRLFLIAPIISFRWSVIFRASRELILLWILSTLPIIMSGIIELQKITFEKWMEAQFDSKVIFIYTSAFLAPVMVTMIDRLVYPKKQSIFEGATAVLLMTVIILIMSAWFYGNKSIETRGLSSVCYVMYGLSIYFWLLAIADEKQEGFGYESAVSEADDKFAAIAAQRKNRE